MQQHRWLPSILCSAVAAVSSNSTATALTAMKQPVNSQTDLPRHSYPMNGPASAFVMMDDAAFRPFADAVLTNVNSTLGDYDIEDRATLRGELESKLILQDLIGDNEAALTTLASLRENQDKPSARLTTGLEEEAILKARILTKTSGGEA